MLPCATTMRVVAVGLLARRLQPVGVALAVAEAQRIGRGLRQLDAGERALVERPAQPLGGGRRACDGRNACRPSGSSRARCGRSSAGRPGTAPTDSPAPRAGPSSGADFGADVIRSASSCGELCAHAATRAPRTRLGQRAHLIEHAAHRVRPGAAVRVEARRQRLDQRRRHHGGIAPRAPPRPPAPGVRMPKPIAIGRSVACAHCAGSPAAGRRSWRVRVPVMPVMLT